MLLPNLYFIQVYILYDVYNIGKGFEQIYRNRAPQERPSQTVCVSVFHLKEFALEFEITRNNLGLTQISISHRLG